MVWRTKNIPLRRAAKKESGFEPKRDLRTGIQVTAQVSGAKDAPVCGRRALLQFVQLKREVAQHWEIIASIAVL
jgi:hypothetical protein